MDTQISGSFDVFWHVEQHIAIQKSVFVEDFLKFLYRWPLRKIVQICRARVLSHEGVLDIMDAYWNQLLFLGVNLGESLYVRSA